MPDPSPDTPSDDFDAWPMGCWPELDSACDRLRAHAATLRAEADRYEELADAGHATPHLAEWAVREADILNSEVLT